MQRMVGIFCLVFDVTTFSILGTVGLIFFFSFKACLTLGKVERWFSLHKNEISEQHLKLEMKTCSGEMCAVLACCFP